MLRGEKLRLLQHIRERPENERERSPELVRHVAFRVSAKTGHLKNVVFALSIAAKASALFFCSS